MADMSGLAWSPVRAAWTLAALLVVTLLLVATCTVVYLHSVLAPAESEEVGYTAASERLAGADKSQPLRMQLEGQYQGPLQDTTIQRWRDPVDGTVCYIYLPIAVAHTAGPAGLVQYGAANIGSISCIPAAKQR